MSLNSAEEPLQMSTLMELLKETTAPMHNSAEGSPFQGMLANGKLSRRTYTQYLEQLLLIHAAIEQEVRAHQNKGTRSLQVVEEKQFQENFLRADLKAFGANPDSAQALESTKVLLAEIERFSKETPEALLGLHYVLLGSKHGGKFVARNLKTVYELEDAGAVYFDPYGQTFMELWKKFKQDMNDLNLEQTTTKAVCKGAELMFVRITEIGDELLRGAKAALPS